MLELDTRFAPRHSQIAALGGAIPVFFFFLLPGAPPPTNPGRNCPRTGRVDQKTGVKTENGRNDEKSFEVGV